jgi:hypothetical protein
MTEEPGGFTPEELERGEDQASHAPRVSCGYVLAFIAGGIAYFVYMGL